MLSFLRAMLCCAPDLDKRRRRCSFYLLLNHRPDWRKLSTADAFQACAYLSVAVSALDKAVTDMKAVEDRWPAPKPHCFGVGDKPCKGVLSLRAMSPLQEHTVARLSNLSDSVMAWDVSVHWAVPRRGESQTPFFDDHVRLGPGHVPPNTVSASHCWSRGTDPSGRFRRGRSFRRAFLESFSGLA